MGRGPDLRLLANSLAGTSAVQLQQAHRLLGDAPWLATLLSHPWAASSSNGIATSSSTHASRGPKETLKQHMPRSKVYNKETYEHLRRSRWDLDEMRKVMEQPSSGLGSSAASTSSSGSSSGSGSGTSSSTSTSTSSGRSSGSGSGSSSRTSGSLQAAIPPRELTRLISEAVTVADIRAVIKHYGASFDAVALSAAITKVPKVAGTQPANGPSTQLPRPPANVERLLDRLVPRLAPLLAVMSVRELSNVLWALSRVGYDPSGEMLQLLWHEVVKGEAGAKLGQANGQELALLTSAAHAWSRRGWVSDEVWHALEDAVVAAAESSMHAAGAASGSTADAASGNADVAFASADVASASADAPSSSGANSCLNGRAVSLIASQFTHERRCSRRLVLSLANWATVPEHAATMSAKELAEFMGALALTPGLTSEVVQTVLGVLSQAAAKKVWDASMNQLGRMAGAVGTYGGPLLLLEAIAGRLEHMTRSSGMGGDSSLLSTSGSSSTSTAPETNTISGSSSNSSSSNSEARTIPGVPAALSKIAWATAQLGGPPRPILLRAAADRLAACPSEFTPAEATYVLSAAAKLSDVPGFELHGWWAEVGRALVPVLGSYSLRHVAMVAYAVSASGQPTNASPKPLLAAIAVEVERRAVELDARSIATILCAFEKLRYAKGVRAAAKLGAVLEQLRQDGVRAMGTWCGR